jgi:hypothetical protein
MTKDEISNMISEALWEDHQSRKPTGLERDLAEFDEILKQVEMYTPLIESYGPKLIERTGPAIRSIMGATFKELMPVLIPVIRQEAQVVAKELVSEYFRQLRIYTAEQIKDLPETMEHVLAAVPK